MMTKERMDYALELIKKHMDKGGKMDDELLDLICDEVLPSLYLQGNYDLNQTNSPVKLNITPSDNSQNIQTSPNKNTASNNTIQQMYNKYDLTTTSSDSLGNVLEIDNRPMVYNMGIMLNQYMEPLFNKISQLESQLNIITNNTEEIKQMIIPAIIVNK